MITVRLETKNVEDWMTKTVKTIKMESDELARDVVMDIRKGARLRERVKRRKKNSKNLLWKGMDVEKIGDKQYMFYSAAPYTMTQEAGARGYHFIPAIGRGRWGEGYAVRGGSIPQAYPHGKQFITDAYMSTYRRLSTIMRRRAERMVR